MSKKQKIILGAVAGLGIATYLAFGFFGIHKAFIDDVVEEENPFDLAASANSNDADSPTPTVKEKPDKANESSTSSSTKTTDNKAEVEPEPTPKADPAPEPETVEAKTPPAPEPEPKPEPAPKQEPVVTVKTEKSSNFSGLGDYDANGTINILSDGNQRFLRFEDNFSADNGPDLKVYLRASNGEILNLGNLKGNVGSQNYEIDVNLDLNKYNKVQIWCQRFSVGFAEAAI